MSGTLSHVNKMLDAERRVALRLSRLSSLQEAFRNILAAAMAIKEVDSCGIYLVDLVAGELRLVIHRGLPNDAAKAVSRYPLNSRQARAIFRGRPITLPADKRKYFQVEEMYRKARLRAATAIPMVYRGEAIASLNVASRSVDRFSRTTQMALETLAAQTVAHLARLRAELALRESDERYRLITEMAFDRISLVALDDLRFLFVNRAAADSLGCSKKELAGRLLPEFLHPDDLAKVPALKAELIRQGRMLVEIRSRGRRGGYRWVEVNGRLIRTRSGQSMALLVSRDITDRRQRQMMAAAESEQRRIGQDLHDGLGQHLTGIQILCSILRAQVGREPPDRLRAAVAEIERLVVQSVEHTNLIARSLLPVPNNPSGLDYALTNLAEMTRNVFGLDCRYEGPATLELKDNRTATHLYRIAQEAVHNAARHGKARRIWIDLRENRSRLILRIRDNGTGLAEGWMDRQGMGLHNMDYRARQLGGSLDIAKRAPHGTVITCKAPRMKTVPAE